MIISILIITNFLLLVLFLCLSYFNYKLDKQKKQLLEEYKELIEINKAIRKKLNG